MGRKGRHNNKASKREQYQRARRTNIRPWVSGRGNESPGICHNERIEEQTITDPILETLRRIVTRLNTIEDTVNLTQSLEADSTQAIYNRLLEIRHLQLPYYYRIAGILRLKHQYTVHTEAVVTIGIAILLLTVYFISSIFF